MNKLSQIKSQDKDKKLAQYHHWLRRYWEGFTSGRGRIHITNFYNPLYIDYLPEENTQQRVYE